MADPGLKSKFVEMQQADHFEKSRLPEATVSNDERAIRLDVARVEEQMSTKGLSPLRRAALFRALKELRWKLRGI